MRVKMEKIIDLVVEKLNKIGIKMNKTEYFPFNHQYIDEDNLIDICIVPDKRVVEAYNSQTEEISKYIFDIDDLVNWIIHQNKINKERKH